ncbi:MAG: IniB N-terminal domain-containing protein [Microbacterium sp.]|uniref:IniB N-terminal domain-containing protein n=1 Tax=Microbacterium sp. TaxID=51671 RepID=UPI003A87F028
MTTAVETIADALIAFILSLLRDPAAAEGFHAQPEAAMAAAGVADACPADVRAVKPVIIDHHSVQPVNPPTPPPPPDNVIEEISNIVNQFTTIDNRSTLIDQSTNQNIWTEGGDVTQVFDQSAIAASGDNSVAAGDDALLDQSDTDVTVGDVAIGNTTDSYNDEVDASDTVEVSIEHSGNVGLSTSGGAESTPEPEAAAAESAPEPEAAAALAAPEPEAAAALAAPEPEPLMTDLTATDDGDADRPLTAPEPEAYPEEIVEDQ